MTKPASKYRIVISDINPPTKKDEICAYRCYFGFSLNNRFLESKHLERLILWISNNFEYCLIVIGDYLNRFNEIISEGVSEEEAVDIGRKKGNLVKGKIEDILNKHDIKNIKAESSYRIVTRPEFKEHYRLVKNGILNNRSAYHSIKSSAISFLERNKHSYQASSSFEDKVKLSIEYILEELTIFSLLISDGLKVQVYPGTHLDILKKISNDEISIIDSFLREGIYVDLSVKKIK